ncbi:MAG: type II toxin-antitoxin system prevent-host-death family antitoxin, partial [Pontibacterium sp.]
TLHLLSVPGMRESIKEGLDSNLSECDQELDW